MFIIYTMGRYVAILYAQAEKGYALRALERDIEPRIAKKRKNQTNRKTGAEAPYGVRRP